MPRRGDRRRFARREAGCATVPAAAHRTAGGSETTAAAPRPGRRTRSCRRDARERLGPVRITGQGLREAAADTVDSGGLEQERPVARGQPIEDLGHQVVADEPVVAGEVRDERLVGGLALQAQRGHSSGPPPSLRRARAALATDGASKSRSCAANSCAASSGVKARSAVRISRSDVRTRRTCSGSTDPRARRARAAAPAACAATRSRAGCARRASAAGARRRVRARRARATPRRVDERRREVGRARGGRLEPGERGAGRDRSGRPQALEHRAPEPERVVVLTLERHPGERQPAPRRPVRDERGLARARGSADQRHRCRTDAGPPSADARRTPAPGWGRVSAYRRAADSGPSGSA